MQKILVALDAVDPDMNVLDFACYLGRLTHSTVTGVFLEDPEEDQKKVPGKLSTTADVGWQPDERTEVIKSKITQAEKNIAWFKEACINREVKYFIHRDTGRPANEMLAESRFADLIVTGPETSFNRSYDGRPTEFVKDLLSKAECPVILAPDNFDTIDEIVFAYNGSASSVFAIKQFTYLFPQLNGRKTTIIQVNKTGKWLGDDIQNFSEWLNDHYTDLHFEVQKGDSDTDLFEWLYKRKNTFIVMGAYGRSSLSRFFKHSHADLPIHILSQPIFIAHL